MTQTIPRIGSPEQARQMIETALQTSDESFMLSIHRALWLEVIDSQPVFEVQGSLRLLTEFYETWRWFRHLGIDDQDVKDVYEQALVLVPKILAHPLPSDLKFAKGTESTTRSALENELQKVPGYTKFIEFARQRLNDVLKMPKYARIDREGLK